MKKIIAISPIGKEYVYKRSSILDVPTKSANEICKILNDRKYFLDDGMQWYVYDKDPYLESYGKATMYKGAVRVAYAFGFCR